MTKIIAFLDTNVFLHFERPEQWQWFELIGQSNVEVRITQITIAELNKHKDQNPLKQLRQRASKTLKYFHEIIDNEINVTAGPVEYAFEYSQPRIDFNAHNLREGSADDQLLASILLEGESGTDKKFVLITDDLGLKLKAQSRQMRVLRPPKGKMLPDAKDDTEKQLEKLRQENLMLKKREPELHLTFENGETFFDLALPEHKPYSNEDHERNAQVVRIKHPEMSVFPSEPSDKGKLELNPFGTFHEQLRQTLLPQMRVNPEDIVKYNGDIQKFYAAYADFRKRQHDYDQITARTFSMSFDLLNSGSSPAEDVDIWIHFPDGFRVCSENELADAPDAPKIPSKPRSQLETIALNLQMVGRPHGLFIPRHNDNIHHIEPPSNVNLRDLRRTNSYEAVFHIGRAKHGITETIGPLYLIFPINSVLTSFVIEYRIHAANLPKPTEGKMHVRILKAI